MRRLVILAFALTLAGGVQAQPTSTTWNANVEKQLVQSLNSPVEAIETSAMHLIIYYESQDRLRKGDRFDLTEAAPQLAQVARTAVDRKRRLLAESALYLVDETRWSELERRLAYRGPRALKEE